jgi:membrane protein implicated in regulation of membrane protease activity
MCVAAIAPGLATWLGIGGTAAGATAAAGTAATIQTVASLAAAAGTLYSGVAGAQAARQQRLNLKAQAATERQLTATEEARRRAKIASQISQQRAEIAARGIDVDSPTAIMLGQTAAQEMSFDAQSVRSGGAARQQELTAQQRVAQGTRVSSILSGTLGAAGGFLTDAVDIWPGLFQGEEQLA